MRPAALTENAGGDISIPHRRTGQRRNRAAPLPMLFFRRYRDAEGAPHPFEFEIAAGHPPFHVSCDQASAFDYRLNGRGAGRPRRLRRRGGNRRTDSYPSNGLASRSSCRNEQSRPRACYSHTQATYTQRARKTISNALPDANDHIISGPYPVTDARAYFYSDSNHHSDAHSYADSATNIAAQRNHGDRGGRPTATDSRQNPERPPIAPFNRT